MAGDNQSWNPWHGCRKYSEGCVNCYMFKLDQALADNGGIFLVIEATEGQSNGVLGAGAPKVFFRYYFVNSNTGEKSGIMLASVTWTAGE